VTQKIASITTQITTLLNYYIDFIDYLNKALVENPRVGGSIPPPATI